MALEISHGQTRMILTGECDPGSSPVLIFHHESFGVGWRSNRSSSLGTAHVSCAVRIKCTDLLFPTPGEGQPDPCWTHRASQCCKGAGGTGGGCDLEEGSACRFTVDVFVHISREKQCCDECDSKTMSKAVIGMLVDGKCYADSLVCQCWKKSSPGIVNRGDKLTNLDLVSRISSIA